MTKPMNALEQVDFCPKCGVRAEGGKYCRWCGTNLALISEALTESQTGHSATAAVQTTLGLFHEAELSNERRDINGNTAMAVFGSIKVDLTAGTLAPGETKMSVYTVLGATEIRVPEDVGIRITGLTMLAAVKIRRKEIGGGFVDTSEYRSPGYEQATRRLHIDAVTVLGELKIKQ
jgi:predicted membrane protein